MLGFKSPESLIFLLGLIQFVMVEAGAAAEPVLYIDSDSTYELGPYLGYLEDASREMTLAEAVAAEFSSLPEQRINFGYTTSLFWLRFQVVNTAPQTVNTVLQTSARFQRPLEIYVGNAPDSLSLQLYNDEDSDFGQRPGGGRHLGIPLRLESGVAKFVYIRFGSGGQAAMNLQLTAERSIRAEQLQLLIKAAAFIGVIGTLILVNVFLFAATGGRVYLAYVLQELCFVLYVCHMDGLTFQFLWPNLPWLNANATPIMGGLCLSAALWFSMAFLRSAEYTPRFYRVLTGLLALLLLESLLSALLPNRLMNQVGLSLFFVLAAVLVPHAIYVLRQGHLAVRYYLGGWLLLISVTAVYSGTMLFGVSWYWNPLDIIKLGMVGEAVVLAMGVADQFRRLHAERNQIHQDLVSQLQVRLEESRDRVQLEREKDAAIRDFADSSKTLAHASHDIAQPLQAMKFAVERTTNHGDSVLANKLSGLVNEMELLVSATLDNAADALQHANEEIETDVSQLLHEACLGHYDAAMEKQLFMREHAVPIRVRINRSAMKRCLNNLISNAIRNTERGGVLVAARWRQADLLIEVYDTGIGIEEPGLEDLQRAFTKGEASPGKGLGLSIVSEICQASGWLLETRSRPARGSRFAIRVPEIRE